MAARNPTALTKWQNIARIETGRSVLSSTFQDIVDDQIYTLDEEQMVFDWRTAQPTNYGTTSASFAEFAASTTGSDFPLKTKDNCASSGNLSHEGAIQAYASDGTTAGELQFHVNSIPSTSGALTLSAGTTSPTWHGWATFNFPSAGAIDTVAVRARRTSGSGTIYLVAFCIFALET